MATKLLLGLASIAAAWALLLILGGGFELYLGGRRVSSNDPVRPLALAALAFAGYAYLTGSRAIQERWARWFDRLGDGRLAALIAIGTTVLGILYSATVGIHSDAYGYVSQVDLWIRGDLFVPEPWVGSAPWPRSEWTFAQLGYRPVQVDGAWAFVPVYSAGLPLVMAIAKMIGGMEFMYWVVPAFGGLLVWMTFAIGRRLGSSRAGLIACWLVATSPSVLLMLMQPMSDVPVAAAWATAIFFAIGGTNRHAALSGLASALAILIRPNLSAVAAVIAVWWLLRGDAGSSGGWRTRIRLFPPILYGLCALPGVLGTAVIYQVLYGSPLTSGYGDLSPFFSWQHVLPNTRLYVTWFYESQGRLALLGLVALALPIRFVWPWVKDRRALLMILGCLLIPVAQYLAYLVFDGPMYVRFFLTCWPFAMLGVAAVALKLFESGRPVAVLLTSAVVLAMGVQGLHHARTSHIFNQWHAHRRSVDFAKFLGRETPTNSVFYTLNYSGTLRYYAARSTIRTDVLDADWFDRSVEWLRSRGLPAYLILDDNEIEGFKKRYAGQTLVAELDDRLVYVYARANSYYVYDLTGSGPRTPRQVEIGDLHALRSHGPDSGAFNPQLQGLAPR